jgi:cell division septal protein FtsQ
MAVERTPGNRIREIKEKQRRRKKVRLIVALISILIIVASVVFISRTKQLALAHIVVRGNYIVSSDDISAIADKILDEKYLWIIPKRNVFLLPVNAITASIHDAYPRFDGVTVKRENWNTLGIDVVERKNTYLWCDKLPSDAAATGTPESCYYIDAHGYIFSQAPTFSGNVYFMFFGTNGWNANESPIGKRVADEETFKDIIRFKEGLEKENLPSYGFILYETGVEGFLLSTNLDDTKQKIVFTNDEDIPALYDNLVSALTAPELKEKLANDFANLLYLDLRYEKKVYYKWSDDAQ